MNESPVYTLHKLLFTLDRAADRLLQKEYGISHKRALFLVVLQRHEVMTQHELATELGHTDPAVSSMLVQLIKDGYITAAISTEHKRKRMIRLTPKGSELVVKLRQVLDGKFEILAANAGIDSQLYGEMTEQIYQTLIKKAQ